MAKKKNNTKVTASICSRHHCGMTIISVVAYYVLLLYLHYIMEITRVNPLLSSLVILVLSYMAFIWCPVVPCSC
ncbi:hypothetical protein GF351_00665 [Candidatus Woesearchaeota archaeon]|nr:hypothetical protein [Candidatus Woesearchaeota archaeon]